MMREFLFTVVLILATAGFIALIRLVTKGMAAVCSRPVVELRIIFDEHCECLEYTLARIYRSPALSATELRVTVVDMIDTDESRQWLDELRKKLKADFATESG